MYEKVIEAFPSDRTDQPFQQHPFFCHKARGDVGCYQQLMWQGPPAGIGS
jgi:hypothetical protein